jgi:phosphoribosyl-AMP cyclohydrolase
MTVTFAVRGSTEEIEEGTALAPKFDGDGLLAAISQDAETGEILMVAWMDRAALAATIESGEAHFYSRSRARMWRKGESSGHVQKVREIRLDCDQDAVLLRVQQVGPGACHVGHTSCFFRRVIAGPDGPTLETISEKTYDPKAVY